MNWIDKIKLSSHSAMHGGMAAGLCILAVAVASCSASLLLHLSEAVTSGVSRQLDVMGMEGLALYTEKTDGSREALPLIRSTPGVRAAMPMSFGMGGVRNQKGNLTAAVFLGVDHQLSEIYKPVMRYGRSFTREDCSGELTAMIDDALAEQLFHRGNAVGKNIRAAIGGQYYSLRIVGVMASQKAGLEGMTGIDIPEIIYLPFSVMKELDPTADSGTVAVSCAEHADQSEIGRELVRKLRREIGAEYRFRNISGYYETAQRVLDLVQGAVTALGMVTGTVSCLGLMTAMLSAVDRRKEIIGIYRALGADRKTVVQLFLLEAVELSMAGGFLGLGAAAAVLSLTPVPIRAMLIWKVWIITGACGAVFGVLPALRAAGLDPIEAMRK